MVGPASTSQRVASGPMPDRLRASADAVLPQKLAGLALERVQVVVVRADVDRAVGGDGGRAPHQIARREGPGGLAGPCRWRRPCRCGWPRGPDRPRTRWATRSPAPRSRASRRSRAWAGAAEKASARGGEDRSGTCPARGAGFHLRRAPGGRAAGGGPTGREAARGSRPGARATRTGWPRRPGRACSPCPSRSPRLPPARAPRRLRWRGGGLRAGR